MSRANADQRRRMTGPKLADAGKLASIVPPGGCPHRRAATNLPWLHVRDADRLQFDGAGAVPHELMAFRRVSSRTPRRMLRDPTAESGRSRSAPYVSGSFRHDRGAAARGRFGVEISGPFGPSADSLGVAPVDRSPPRRSTVPNILARMESTMLGHLMSGSKRGRTAGASDTRSGSQRTRGPTN